MASFLPSLNNHIYRLARREVRQALAKLKRSSAQHRRDIAALKRRNAELVKMIAKAGKAAKMNQASESDDGEKMRFRKDGLRTHRAKLGISASDYGKLVGVSGLTIYNWEAGKTKPRQKQLAALAGVRKLGKRAALSQLA